MGYIPFLEVSDPFADEVNIPTSDGVNIPHIIVNSFTMSYFVCDKYET